MNNFRKYLLPVILLVFVLNNNNFSQPKELTKLNKAFNFFVIGDWGRNGYFNQKELAEVMNNTAGKIWPYFVATTGDNFYENGVASIDDPLWMSSFENVYDGGNLLMEWRPTFGNHDYKGNTQAQIDYREKSRRWNMPDYYYSVEKKMNDSTRILLLFLDTNQFEDSYYQSPNTYPDLANTDPGVQLRWIDSSLANTDAKWKILIGHHHVYSGGVRKNEISSTRTHLEPLLDKYNVDAYFCGHEHDLQHIKKVGPTHYFVSGAGSQLRTTGEMEGTLFAASTQGFCIVSIINEELLVQMIDYKGDVIYMFPILK